MSFNRYSLFICSVITIFVSHLHSVLPCSSSIIKFQNHRLPRKIETCTDRIYDRKGNCLEYCHDRFGIERSTYDGNQICGCVGYDCKACWHYSYNVPVPSRFRNVLGHIGLNNQNYDHGQGGVWYKEPCRIVGLEYHYDEAKWIKSEALSLGKVVVANRCSKADDDAGRCPNQEKTLIIWTLTTSTDTWNRQSGASIAGGLTFTSGIPLIYLKNTANTNLGKSKTHTLGKSEARQTRWQSFDKCVATPGQMTTCQFYVYRTELQVPFTIIRSDGRQTYGVYTGVDYFYGGTTICYHDLWTPSIKSVYYGDDECHLPTSFKYPPPYLLDNSSETENDVVVDEDSTVPRGPISTNILDTGDTGSRDVDSSSADLDETIREDPSDDDFVIAVIDK